MQDNRRVQITETPRIPWLSVLLGYAPVMLLAAGAMVAWLTVEPVRSETRACTLIWGSAILLFLAGVRRGLSFRTEGGATVAQIATMLWLFLLGLAALLLIPFRIAPVLLLTGYLSIAVLDPIAARRGEAPLFFARLRPIQMAIPVVGLIALTAL